MTADNCSTMMRIIIGVLIFAASSGGEIENRIVGGEATDIWDVPFIVSLRHFGKHICGGTIYRTQWIITAAHCMNQMNTENNEFINGTYGMAVMAGSSTLKAGESGSQYVPVDRSFIHPKYTAKSLDYDVALLKLAFPLSYSSTVQRIPLAMSKPSWGTTGIISGWGSARRGGEGDASNQLRSAKIRVMSPIECKLFYFFELTDRMICGGYYLGGVSPCLGDSGGPLVVDGTLAGIISFIRNCGTILSPAVFAEVSQVRTFIDYVSTHY